MPAKRKALGRGLDALFPVRHTEQAPTAEETRTVEEIDIDAIVPNPYQPRQTITESALQELADSIRAQGVLQPILLRRIDRRYQIVAGERRWRASRLAGMSTVPAIIVDLGEREMLEWALLENLQREDLNAIEEARAYQTLLEEFDLSQEELARHVGRQRSSIANSLRLLKLPEAAQQQIIDGVLSAGHGRALLAVEDPRMQRTLHEQILRDRLSVRQAEALVPRLNEPQTRKPKARNQPPDPQLADLAERLTDRLGVPASIRPANRTRGRLEIQYNSLDDLDRVIEAILGKEAQRL